MQVCKVRPEKLGEALDLIWEVFEQYEAPDYEEMGIKTFRHFIELGNMVEKVSQGERMVIGRRLVRVAVSFVMEQEPRIRAVTVNSSPFAVEFYKSIGFVPLGPERAQDGIRFTSMKMTF